MFKYIQIKVFNGLHFWFASQKLHIFDADVDLEPWPRQLPEELAPIEDIPGQLCNLGPWWTAVVMTF
jgi:hypothetical protein